MYSTKKGNRFIFLLLLIMIIGRYALRYIIITFNIHLNNISKILIPQLIFILIPVILYFIITKQNIIKTLMLKKLGIINALIAIGISILIQPFLNLINLISQLFFENHVSSTIFNLTYLPLWLLLILVAVLPAINEEIVTRGILLSNYKNVGLVKAALISGLYFGMLHLNGNQFSYAFVMGTILFMLVKITNSIYSSMIVHFMINGLQVSLAKLYILFQHNFNLPDYTQNMPKVTSATIFTYLPSMLILTFITLPIVYLLFYASVKHNKKENLFCKVPTDSLEVVQPKIFDIYLILSIILFIAYVTVNEIMI